MTQFLDADKTVLDDVTFDLCTTCKIQKIMALDSIRTLELYQRKTLLQCEANLPTKMVKYTNY